MKECMKRDMKNDSKAGAIQTQNSHLILAEK